MSTRNRLPRTSRTPRSPARGTPVSRRRPASRRASASRRPSPARPHRSLGQWLLRHRRPLLAALVFVAVLSGLRALAPDHGETRRVFAAAHSLPAGHELTQDDLVGVDLSGDSAPGETTEANLVGRRLAVAWPRGLPLHRSAFAGADVTRHLPAGQVAVGLQPGRGSPIGFIRPGDEVDVIVTVGEASEQQHPEIVTRAARVLSVSGRGGNGAGGTKGDSWSSGDDSQEPVVVVAVPRAAATQVSAAPQRGAVSLVVSG